MSVKERYGTMMDNAFGGYYDLFRKQKALSSDMQMIRKMVSFGVVKKSGDAGLWLDEGKVSNPGNVLRQRLLIILAALILAVAYCWFMGDFIF